jgi:hypothetical protein
VLLGILNIRVKEREEGVALSAAPFCFCLVWVWIESGEEDGNEEA